MLLDSERQEEMISGIQVPISSSLKESPNNGSIMALPAVWSFHL
jgi:hypothetical protein